MIHFKMKPQAKKIICKQKHAGKSIGKGKNNGSPTTKEKCIKICTETSNNVLSFPLLKTIDRDKLLPRFSTVLNRSVEEGVTMDDLDALQLELEVLLSAVVVRSRVICKEINALNCVEERNKKGNGFNKIPGKQSSIDEKPVKKFKDLKPRETGNTPASIQFTMVKTIPMNINSSPNICMPECEPSKSVTLDSPRVLQPRYDVPNKFWSSVDPYCCDITQDDINVLEDLVKECEDYKEYQKIPPLGCHYSLRWAQEDLMSEQEEGHNEPKTKNKVNVSILDSHSLLKKGEKACENLTNNPLTQHLVSVLMEESDKIHNNNEKSDSKPPLGSENNSLGVLYRNYSAIYCSNFERKVQKELEDQGLFDIGGHSKKDGNDDEILQEIKRCQTELQTLSTYNQMHLKRLINLAHKQMSRQEVKRKLNDTDNEVMEHYRNLVAAKQKKKALSKAEQDLCWKSLKEREELIKQLDRM